MSSPFSVLDDTVYDQVLLFAPLLATLGNGRIRTPTRRTDIRVQQNTGDMQTTIWIVPGGTNELPFTASETDDWILQWDIVVSAPSDDFEHSRDIQWQITRAMRLLLNGKDAAGNTIDNSAFSPVNWQHAKTTDWTHARSEKGVFNSRMRLQISVNADRSDLFPSSAVAPTVLEVARLIHEWADIVEDETRTAIKLLHVKFDQLMTAVRHEDTGTAFLYYDDKGNEWSSRGWLIRPQSRYMLLPMVSTENADVPTDTLLYPGGESTIQSAQGVQLESFSIAVINAA